jgi:hypothetical protein
MKKFELTFPINDYALLRETINQYGNYCDIDFLQFQEDLDLGSTVITIKTDLADFTAVTMILDNSMIHKCFKFLLNALRHDQENNLDQEDLERISSRFIDKIEAA